MSSLLHLTIFLRLQQVVLDTEDHTLLVNNLLSKALVELPSAGLPAIFINVEFFPESSTEVQAAFFVDNQTISAGGDIALKNIVKTDLFLKDHNPVYLSIIGNKIASMMRPSQFIDPGYSQRDNVETLILSPIFTGRKLTGVLIIGTGEKWPNLPPEIADFIEILTNLTSFVYRLEDTQASLTKVSQDVYKMNSRLHSLDKLKDDFVSVASHELRTPMTAIKSYLWMAMAGKGGPLTDKQKYYLERAYNSTDRLIKLVNDMLNISRIESGRITIELEKVDMTKLIEDVTTEVRPRADELGIQVEINQLQPYNLLPVLADPDKMKEVLINLVGNSLKFTPSGGKIRVFCTAKEGFVETSVVDTGHGIEPADLPKLFSKFGLIEGSYITNKHAAGTGLGLYISKSIVEIHKGKIWATSEGVDKGATFTFSLPVYKPQDESLVTQKKEGVDKIGIIHTVI